MESFSTICAPISALKFLEEALYESIGKTVKTLAVHYGFDEKEALEMVGVVVEKTQPKKAKEAKEPKEKKEKVERVVPLPWTNEIKEDWCYGLRVNYGTFTQCVNEPLKNKGDGDLFGKLCSTCLRQCEKNKHGQPTAGLVTERNEEFVSPTGKKATPYTKVMKTVCFTREDAEREAERLGFTLTDEMFAEDEVKKRGRPSKEEKKPEEGEKKRGRPAKEKKKVSVTSAEELLEELESQGAIVAERVKSTAGKGPIIEAKRVEKEVVFSEEEDEDEEPKEVEKKKEVVFSEDEDEDEDDGTDEEVSTVDVVINGKTYVMKEDEENEEGAIVYTEEGEEVGRYALKNGKAFIQKEKKQSKSRKK